MKNTIQGFVFLVILLTAISCSNEKGKNTTEKASDPPMAVIVEVKGAQVGPPILEPPCPPIPDSQCAIVSGSSSSFYTTCFKLLNRGEPITIDSAVVIVPVPGGNMQEPNSCPSTINPVHLANGDSAVLTLNYCMLADYTFSPGVDIKLTLHVAGNANPVQLAIPTCP